MSPYLIVAFMLVVLVIDHIWCSARLGMCMKIVKTTFEYAESIKEQHERYVDLAKGMEEWYNLILKSNQEVDQHYETVNKQYENVMSFIKLTTNNKEEN